MHGAVPKAQKAQAPPTAHRAREAGSPGDLRLLKQDLSCPTSSSPPRNSEVSRHQWPLISIQGRTSKRKKGFPKP